jgi:hypothetical protein
MSLRVGYVRNRFWRSLWARLVLALVLVALMAGPVHAAKLPNGTWRISPIESGLGQYGGFSSIGLDSQDRPHVAYLNYTTMTLRYATQDATGWHTENVGAAGSGAFCSLAVDQQDRPHIVSLGYADPAGTIGVMRHAVKSDGAWTVTDVYTGLLAYYIDMTLDSDGHPHVAYVNQATGSLEYAYSDGVAWHQQSVKNVGTLMNDILTLSIALDSAGQPHISYYDIVGKDLRYASRSATGAWATEPVDTANDQGKSSALALDADDVPVIAYRDSTSTKLKLARKAGGVWQITTLDGTSNTGWYPCLRYDQHGRLNVSYREVTGGATRYAYQSAAGWVYALVDSTGDAGGYTSLALDRQGQPWIAYFDFTSRAVRVAQWVAAGPKAFVPMIVR